MYSDIDISEYISHIGEFIFPDYSQECPLCKGKDCAVRIGFYYRKKTLIGFTNFYDIPIARWLCQNKGIRKIPHCTFSLLPHMLVPYQRHDISFMLEAVKTNQTSTNYSQTSDIMAKYSKNDDILIENRQIISFLNIFKEAYYKLTAFTEIKKQLLSLSIPDPIDAALAFIDAYMTYRKTNNHKTMLRQGSATMLRQGSVCMPSIEILTIDFFYDIQQSRDLCDRLFLFGTPTQKRYRLSKAGFT